MQRVYLTNGANQKGVTDITSENCTFDIDGKSTNDVFIPLHADTVVYSNSD